MNFKDLVMCRRSCRQYTEEEISADDLQLIIRAALMSPTSKNSQAWKFVIVDDKTKIEKLSDSKEHGSNFLRSAPLCIVVLGNTKTDDCWIENCSIAAYSMLLQAEDLGLGACWVQIRGRVLTDGTSVCDVVRGILGLPDDEEVLCIIGIGYKKTHCKPKDEDKVKWENVIISD
jgi:nitroreductase